MRHPPGAVIVPCQDTARYHRFTASLTNLQLPEGSHVIFGIGTSIVDNLNSSIRRLRAEDEWVWIVGDDHVFPPDTLMRLLERDADMIAPLCVRRGPPFPLVHYQAPLFDGSPHHRTVQFSDLPETDEPFEVQVTGSLPLIRRYVLDELTDPWFTDPPGEEFGFCKAARSAGFVIYVDPAVTVGHISEIVAYPAHQDGEWGLLVDHVGADPQPVFYPGGMNAKVAA
jgi:hypothetical protein